MLFELLQAALADGVKVWVADKSAVLAFTVVDGPLCGLKWSPVSRPNLGSAEKAPYIRPLDQKDVILQRIARRSVVVSENTEYVLVHDS